jgi:hypothetical protein
MEEVRQELNQYVAFNHGLFMRIRELKDRTKSLLRDMDAILAMQPPVPLHAMHFVARTNSSELYVLPKPLPDSCNQNDGESTTIPV